MSSVMMIVVVMILMMISTCIESRRSSNHHRHEQRDVSHVIKTNSWTRVKNSIPASFDFAHAQTNDYMIVYGGVNSNFTLLDTIYMYDFHEDHVYQITSKINTPPSRKEAVGYISQSEDEFIIVGGTDAGGKLLGEMWRFNMSSNEWKMLIGSDTLIMRTGHFGVRFPDTNYYIVFGGEVSDKKFSNDLLFFNGKQWKLMKVVSEEKPSPRKYSPIVNVPIVDEQSQTIQDSLVIFGGLIQDVHGNVSVDNELWQYTFADNRWHLIDDGSSSNAPGARNAHNLFYDSNSNNLYMFGGESPTYDGLNDLWIYSFDTRQWNEVTVTSEELPPIRLGAGQAVINKNGTYTIAIFNGITGWTKQSGKHVLSDTWKMQMWN